MEKWISSTQHRQNEFRRPRHAGQRRQTSTSENVIRSVPYPEPRASWLDQYDYWEILWSEQNLWSNRQIRSSGLLSNWRKFFASTDDICQFGIRFGRLQFIRFLRFSESNSRSKTLTATIMERAILVRDQYKLGRRDHKQWATYE